MASAHTLLFTWNPLARTLCINALTSGLCWNVISPIYVIVSPFSVPLGCIINKAGTRSLLFTVYEDVKDCFLLCPNHKHPLRSTSQPSLPLPISIISLLTPKIEFHNYDAYRLVPPTVSLWHLQLDKSQDTRSLISLNKLCFFPPHCC